MRALLRAVMGIFAWTIVPVTASAQVAGNAPIEVPHLEGPHGTDAARDVPIGSYTLATFWVPQHCKQAIRGIAALQCATPEVRGGSLALHGLWPDGVGKEWPQWCRPAALLSPATIGAHIAATPSAQQMQHEWAKHGTCMAGYSPERYFDRSEQLYRGIRMPDLRALSYRRQTVASVKQAIAEANPGLKTDQFKLTLDRQGWFQEIWFCLDTRFARATCAEPQREAAGAAVQIWRGGRASRRRYSSGNLDRERNYRRSRYG